MIWASPGTTFWHEFNCNSDYVIWTLHFENIWYGNHQASFFGVNSTITVFMSSKHYILKIYDMGIIRHHFLVRIQLWQWLCHLNTTFWKYMIWSSSGIIFQCKFGCKGDYVFWTLYSKKYDMGIIRHHFSVQIRL